MDIRGILARLRRRSGLFVFRLVAAAGVAALVVSLIPPLPVRAAGETISGGSNKTGLIDEYISLSGLTVNGDPDETIPVALYVDSGELSMTDTSGLTFHGPSTGNALDFEGTISDINAALATLQYLTSRPKTVTLTAYIPIPGEVFFPGTGHVYEIVGPSPITANNARVAAAGRTKYGIQGYLATITSKAERDYVGQRLGGDGWFGASDAETEGDWKWITGPEAGTSFWSGPAAVYGGMPVPGQYSDWAPGEPNELEYEDCAQFYSNGQGWNDLDCDTSKLDYYIVEYGAPGNLPPIQRTSFTITVSFPDADDVPIGSCLDLIDVQANEADHLYDNLYLTTDIDCTGETLTPMFNEPDPDHDVLGFRGEFDGRGFAISGIEINEAGNSVGLFAATQFARIHDVTLESGDVIGAECVGALVGHAYDTVIENVASGVGVAGDYHVGGLIGCMDTVEDSAVLRSGSSAGAISGYENVGGLIGRIQASDTLTAEVLQSSFDGELVDAGSSNNMGGIVGCVWGVNGEINIVGNESAGSSLPDVNSYGGIVGWAFLDDIGTMTMEGNVLTSDMEGASRVGGLIGNAEGWRSRFIIKDSSIEHNVTGSSHVGGFVGLGYLGDGMPTNMTIQDSSVTGDVTGEESAGGLIGSTDLTVGTETFVINRIYTSGTVTAVGDNAGGLVGLANGVRINNSYTDGVVEGANQVGGLIGYDWYSTISKSYATGEVAAVLDNAGGLVGYSRPDSIIEYSFATADVTANYRAGGLVGNHFGTIRNSYARGSVTTHEDEVGSLVGVCEGDIAFSYGTGQVTGIYYTGGLAGSAYECDSNSSFWDADTSTQASSPVGTAKTTVEMKTKATFTDTENSDGLDEAWNFSSIWGMDPSINDGYPCLTWQANCMGDDEDGDGVPTVVELAAPNDGDANNDGIPDYRQSNVASFVNPVTNSYAVVVLHSACAISMVTSESEASQTAKDSGFNYPRGLVRFTADCGTSGFTTTVRLLDFGANGDFVVRKHNPDTAAYFTIDSAVMQQVVIGGQQALETTYQITDGGILDIDGLKNGVIVDPVGLAVGVVGVPNTGLGGRLQ